MSLEQEERRGEEARRILNAPLYREAYSAIRERIVVQLGLADLPEDKRKRLNDLLVALTKVQQYMDQVLVSGTLAAQEIERKQTLAERVKSRFVG